MLRFFFEFFPVGQAGQLVHIGQTINFPLVFPLVGTHDPEGKQEERSQKQKTDDGKNQHPVSNARNVFLRNQRVAVPAGHLQQGQRGHEIVRALIDELFDPLAFVIQLLVQYGELLQVIRVVHQLAGNLLVLRALAR